MQRSETSGGCPGRTRGGAPRQTPPTKPTSPHNIHNMTKPYAKLKQHAREMRNNPTHEEHLLWQHIRMGQIDGHRFLRQRPIDNMIVDFVCRGPKLVIELDGGHHDEQRQADQARTKRLNQRGYRVIRFWNNQITQNLDGVLQTIQQALKS